MPANYLAWRTGIYVDFDPHQPDAQLQEEHLRDTKGCPDCPLLVSGGVPVFIRDETRGKTGMVLCGNLESFTGGMGMTRGCASNKSRRCEVHEKQVDLGEHGTVPLRVYEEGSVVAKFDHQQRMIEVTRKSTLSALSPQELEQLADEVVQACDANLRGGLRQLESVKRRFPGATTREEQCRLVEQLLELYKRSKELTAA